VYNYNFEYFQEYDTQRYRNALGRYQQIASGLCRQFIDNGLLPGVMAFLQAEIENKNIQHIPNVRIIPKNLREALDQIQEMLRDRNYGLPLWGVLTALRGPDSNSTDIKMETTIPIRMAAFPLLANDRASEVQQMAVFKSHLKTVTAAALATAGRESPHFADHARAASTHLDIGPLSPKHADVDTRDYWLGDPQTYKKYTK
jgi:hypothetical protein